MLLTSLSSITTGRPALSPCCDHEPPGRHTSSVTEDLTFVEHYHDVYGLYVVH
jgi:hypothetical protein